MYESQLAQLTQQTFNMESAALATENLRNTMATVDAMKLANKELRKQYGRIDVDKIEVRVRRVRSLQSAHGHCRPCILTWKTCWSKQTRFKKRSEDLMPSLTRSMKQICRLVSFTFGIQVNINPIIYMLSHTELDALALEEPEENTSYLTDLNKEPDFIDEPPLELNEVSAASAVTIMSLTSSSKANSCRSGSCQDYLLKLVLLSFHYLVCKNTLVALIL